MTSSRVWADTRYWSKTPRAIRSNSLNRQFPRRGSRPRDPVDWGPRLGAIHSPAPQGDLAGLAQTQVRTLGTSSCCPSAPLLWLSGHPARTGRLPFPGQDHPPRMTWVLPAMHRTQRRLSSGSGDPVPGHQRPSIARSSFAEERRDGFPFRPCASGAGLIPSAVLRASRAVVGESLVSAGLWFVNSSAVLMLAHRRTHDAASCQRATPHFHHGPA